MSNAARRLAFSIHERVENWTLVYWDRGLWRARCDCGHAQWISLRRGWGCYVPQCRNCKLPGGALVPPARAKHLTSCK
jgi:hypothetical protein